MNPATDALRALIAIRPTNWNDEDDPEQQAAWQAADDALIEAERRGLATSAASQASIALAELMRFASEGTLSATYAFDTDVIEQLLDAAKMAIEVEAAGRPLGDHGQIYSALVKHLEGWA